MQIQGNTDLAASPHTWECDGAEPPGNNFQTHEGKKGYWGSHQYVFTKGISCQISLIVFRDETVLVREREQ